MKLMSLIMALVLLVVPFAALGEQQVVEEDPGFFFKINEKNLNLKLYADGEPFNLDLSGLEANVEMLYNDALGISTNVSNEGESLLGMNIVFDSEKLTLYLDGSDKGYTISYAQILSMLEEAFMSALSPEDLEMIEKLAEAYRILTSGEAQEEIAGIMAVLEANQLAPAGEETAVFYGGVEKQAEKMTMTITGEQLQAYVDAILKLVNKLGFELGEVDTSLYAAGSAEAAFWIADADVRLEETVFHNGEKLGTILMIISGDDEAPAVRLEIAMEGEEAPVVFDFYSKPVEGALCNMFGVVIEVDGSGLYIDGIPGEDGDAKTYRLALRALDEYTDDIITFDLSTGASSQGFVVEVNSVPVMSMNMEYELKFDDNNFFSMDGTIKNTVGNKLMGGIEESYTFSASAGSTDADPTAKLEALQIVDIIDAATGSVSTELLEELMAAVENATNVLSEIPGIAELINPPAMGMDDGAMVEPATEEPAAAGVAA